MANDDPRVLRQIAESEFYITDICPRYSADMVGATNCFCVFHDNKNSPSAKIYYDEDRGIPVLHCFAEHRTYTSYDYINLILVNKKQQYKSVQDYLIKHLGERKFNELYTLAVQGSYLDNESLIEQTIEYIDNTYAEHDNVIDYINCLYLEKD